MENTRTVVSAKTVGVHLGCIASEVLFSDGTTFHCLHPKSELVWKVRKGVDYWKQGGQGGSEGPEESKEEVKRNASLG